MTLPDPYAVLQALHAQVAGIARAETALPTAINTADLPLVIVYPGAATWERNTSGGRGGWSVLMRIFTVDVYVKPLGQGQGVNEGFQACLPLLTQMGCLYSFDRSLGANVDGIDQITDTGPQAVTFNNQEYWGFTYRLRVKQLFEVPDPSALTALKIAHIIVNQPIQPIQPDALPFNVPPPSPH